MAAKLQHHYLMTNHWSHFRKDRTWLILTGSEKPILHRHVNTSIVIEKLFFNYYHPKPYCPATTVKSSGTVCTDPQNPD